MKKKRANNLRINTITAILPQLATIISGFLVPRLVLEYFGSEVNGLVQSITQFLSIISFMEAGVGSVIRFNLYKPLHEKNKEELSKIIISARKFFRRIALLLLVYTAVLMLIYPLINGEDFGHIYIATLIAAMCISYFAQYYFGQVNQLLLTADQCGYIQYLAQALTIVGNVIVSVILIRLGAGIHIVRLASSIVFLLRPLFLQWYVSRKYDIDYTVHFDGEPIKQKWNGLAQHITAVILESTDVVVLTSFSSLSNVSIYSAYHMVVYGIKTLMTSATNGIEAYLGNVIAGGDKSRLNEVFSITEWTIHTAAAFVYGCTATLIVPFIIVYTNGIHDANYNVPVFGILITLANYCHTLRLPYNIVILSSGHYKQTQKSYVIAAIINIVVSILFVAKLGLVGVAIGTLASMAYHITWLAIYGYKIILGRHYGLLIKQLMVDAISMVVICISGKYLALKELTYIAWIILAIKQAIINALIVIIVNICFYKNNINRIVQFMGRRKKID